MNMPHEGLENTEKNKDQIKELKTEFPMSEKDEVKAAERKTGKLHEKAASTKKEK
jgi:hypothetical protein